jgi:hypothetical protein
MPVEVEESTPRWGAVKDVLQTTELSQFAQGLEAGFYSQALADDKSHSV